MLLLILLINAVAWGQLEEPVVDYMQILQARPTEPFKRVTAPRPFIFPEDHGAHPDYRLEWWYVTGNLVDGRNNAMGFQLTFFRTALGSGEGEGWKSPHLYLGHFALTDQLSDRHYAFERLSRTGAGLSGVRTAPFEVWLDNWLLKSLRRDRLFPLRLSARARDRQAGVIALELRLENQKPIVLQGDRGFSPKSATGGNASHYYSYTRLAASGEVQIGERHAVVSGSAWLDREWGSSSLAEDQVGWDWFALQLDDGRELMFYRLRRSDGTMDPYSRGVLVAADGSYRQLMPADIELAPIAYWHGEGASRYPIKWRVKVPGAGLAVTLEPIVDDQAWKGRFRYWEGAVKVTGSHTGRGYLELTGY